MKKSKVLVVQNPPGQISEKMASNLQSFAEIVFSNLKISLKAELGDVKVEVKKRKRK